MSPEQMAKEILQQMATALEPVLTRALTAAHTRWTAEAQKDIKRDLAKWMEAAPVAVPDPFKLTAPPSGGNGDGRALRGAVGAAVKKVLEANPGATTTEVQTYAVAVDKTISEKSASNELFRKRGKAYRYDKGKWFNM